MASDHMHDAKIALGILTPKGTSDGVEDGDGEDKMVDGEDGDGEVTPEQETAGEHLIEAIKDGDAKRVAQAICAIYRFEEASEPEGPEELHLHSHTGD